MFLDASTKRPTVVLPEVSGATLRQLLAFVYTGEVQVDEQHLDPLLEAAEMLQIRGLTDGESSAANGHVRKRSSGSSGNSSSVEQSPVKKRLHPMTKQEEEDMVLQ